MSFDFKQVLEELKTNEKWKITYTSEAELQFILMQIIKELYPEATVRCEVEPDIDLEIRNESSKNNVIRIDIVVFFEEEIYPIEVKFRKTNLKAKYHESDAKIEILYHDQDAPDDAAYFYINDIHRMEQFCEKYQKKYPKVQIKGYTLFVTNQEKYKGGYNNRTAWKDINIFQQEKDVVIRKHGKGRISGKDRKYFLKREYKSSWETYEIKGNEFYLFWNEIHSN